MKKILFGFGLLSVLFLNGCAINVDPTIEKECTIRQESTEFVEYDIEFCITGVDVVDAEISMLIDFLSEEAKMAGKELVDIESTRKGGLYISQENYSSVGDVKSTLLNVSLNTGGAHPNTFFHTWTYRENAGTILKFHSLFQSEHNPLWTLYPMVKKSLLAQIGEGADERMIEEGTGDLNMGNYQNFVLDGEKLVLLFEPYQVAPYAAGPQKVEIPFEDLQVIFQPPFLDTAELPVKKETDHSVSCDAVGGNWLASHGECEMISQEWCGEEMGIFKSCESACRHDPAAEMCTMQCVQVCEF